MKSMIVVGSANIDFVIGVEHLPKPGETVSGKDIITTYGGKGANQAVAAARLGASVGLVCSLGEDTLGCEYREYLNSETINLLAKSAAAGTPTGCALILVDSQGQNIIAVSPGANRCLTPDDVDNCLEHIAKACLLVLQAEIPIETVCHTIRQANKLGVEVLFNPSPMPKAFPWGEVHVDYLVLNETEVGLVAQAPLNNEDALVCTAKSLLDLSITHVIVTQGSKSTLLVNAKDTAFVPTISIVPVDSVGAGDAFAGALSVALLEGKDVRDAVMFANGAGALAAMRHGAQASLPTRQELDLFLEDENRMHQLSSAGCG